MSFDTPTIYIVDDDQDILHVTQKLLESNDWNVICVSDATKFLDIYRTEQSGCLVLDLQMPDINGLELQQRLVDRNIDIPIVFITGNGSVENSVTALKAGAHDFIEKPFTRDTLIQTVEAALKNQAALREKTAQFECANKRFSDLTEREWEVLNSMVSGPAVLSSKEIARELDISHRTVEHHRSHIMEKTQCPSLPELMRLASFIGIANPNLAADPL